MFFFLVKPNKKKGPNSLHGSCPIEGEAVWLLQNGYNKAYPLYETVDNSKLGLCESSKDNIELSIRSASRNCLSESAAMLSDVDSFNFSVDVLKIYAESACLCGL